MSIKKRIAAMLVSALVVSILLTVGASAAVDGVGGGFSLWNLLDGIGGFFRDLINSIGGFFANLISAVKNIGNVILDALAKVVNAIGNAISYLLSGLKYLFIPSRESFSSFRDDILNAFDKKVGSVFSALNYLKTRFGGLTAKNGLSESFKITFPKGSFLNGLSIDLIASPLSVLLFIRGVVTGIYFIQTALIIYHKIIAMVNA